MTSAAANVTPDAQAIIAALGLEPHPEGGFYRETFRDRATDASGRAASTAIYFLLPEGQVSRWHKVDATEIWHWHAGAPLELGLAPPNGAAQRTSPSGLILRPDCFRRASCPPDGGNRRAAWARGP